MKKLTTLLFTLFMILLPIQSVHAASFSTSISGPTQITAGQTFTVTISVSNTTHFQGFTAALGYDRTKLSLVSSSILLGVSGWSMDIGTSIVMVGPEKSGSFKVLSLTFKATNSFTVGQTTKIDLSGIYYSTQYGDTHDTTTRSLSVNMVSDDSYLKTLTVSSGSLSFSKTTTDYTVVVDNSVTSVTVNATPDYTKATVSGTGTKSLAIYSNVFTIVVTAENGAKRTYTVNVERKDANGLASPPSTNDNLRSITISGYDAFNTAFDKANLTYSLDVGNLVTDLTITAVADDAKSKVDIVKAPLAIGPNTVTIKVTAESGDTKTYTITINRSSDVPTVSMDEIINALNTVTTTSIGLIPPADGVITTDILSALKTSGKTLNVEYKENGKILYEWLIDGTKITDAQPINTKILFTSDLKPAIDKLTNFAQGMILSFETNASLPEGTTVRLYVSDAYADGSILNLYFYNEQSKKLTDTVKNLTVTNGKVEFVLTHSSTYFLSPAQLKTSGILDYLFVLVSIAEAFIIVVLILRPRRPRKVKRDL